jgi:signal transduction histidine kinase
VLAELLHHARRRAERSERTNRELETEILAVSDAEKRRIGHDLHDGLGQHLTGLSFMAKALAQRLTQSDSELAQDAARIADLSNKSIAWTRDLAHGLQPVAVEDNGLQAALETLCGEVSRHSGIQCRFESDSFENYIPAEIATNLYRIAQESITNALKHSGARSIRVSLIQVARALTLTVEDDGRGIDPQRTAKPVNPGLGLQIMHYRARMIGGTLAVTPSEADGTSVACTVQLPALEGT